MVATSNAGAGAGVWPNRVTGRAPESAPAANAAPTANPRMKYFCSHDSIVTPVRRLYGPNSLDNLSPVYVHAVVKVHGGIAMRRDELDFVA